MPEKEKGQPYNEFLEIINRKQYKYSQITTGIRKIHDFFLGVSSAKRAEKSVKRVVKDKKASCWDLALAMSDYLTNGAKIQNWIVAYDIGLGIPHTSNLVNWYVYNLPESHLIYPVQLHNIAQIDPATVVVHACLLQIDPLFAGDRTHMLPPHDRIPNRAKFHGDNSNIKNWLMMDNRGKKPPRQTLWAKFFSNVRKTNLKLTNKNGKTKEYIMYNIQTVPKFNIKNPFTFW